MTLIIGLVLPAGLPVAPARAEGSAQSILSASPLPAPGTRITRSAVHRPATLAGIRIHADGPLRMDFIIDEGDDPLTPQETTQTHKRLINYFLAALTVPQDQLWVNLSPEEADRIIPDDLVKTEMGRDMLAMDYLLKQLMASLLYPEDGVGSEFWRRVHQKAQQQFGTTDIPTDTFNKIWIVPQQAHVHVHDDHVWIVDSDLDVMLEEDYLNLPAHTAEREGGDDGWSEHTKDLIREVVVPEIKREINTGRQFANLRQIYHAMLLAAWYKKNLRDSIINRVYADQNLVEGIDLAAADVKEKIYQQYLEAFRKGAFDYIREDLDPVSGEPLPRRYFSGGLKGYDQAMISEAGAEEEWYDDISQRPLVRQSVNLRLVDAPGAASNMPSFDLGITELPDADDTLFRRLEMAHFHFNVYGETPAGIEFAGAGFSRRAFTLSEEFPNLVFKMPRRDTHSEPPAPTEAAELAEVVHKTGYEFITIDGMPLIRAPGLAPFRYHNNAIVQLRGRPTTDVQDFHNVVAQLRGLGIKWDMADTKAPETQLKNIMLFDEEVNGEIRTVARLTDLKGLSVIGNDEAVLAEDQQELRTLFTSFAQQTPFLWRRVRDTVNEIAARGQATATPQRDAELLAKLRLMLRTVMSMRELPVLQDNRPVTAYPDIDSSAPSLFYLTVDDILTGIEGHIVHVQKFIAPQRFGPPPADMLPLSEAVLLLKKQTLQAEQSFKALDGPQSYPLLRTGSGYRVYTDLLTRNISPKDFQDSFVRATSGLGLRPGPVHVGATNLGRIEDKLTLLLRQSRQVGHLSGELDARMRESVEDLESEILRDIAALIDVIELRQFPAGSTNQLFVDAVVAATVREMLLDLFGPALDWNGMKLSADGDTSPDLVLALRDGINDIRQEMEHLVSRDNYVFVIDESTSLISVQTDSASDEAVLVTLNDKIKQRFRRLNRLAIMPLHQLNQTIWSMQGDIKAMRGEWDEAAAQDIVRNLRNVQHHVQGLAKLLLNVPIHAGEEAEPEDLRIVRDTLNTRIERLNAALTQTLLEVDIHEEAKAEDNALKLDIFTLVAGELQRFSRFVADAGRYERVPLLRTGETVTVFDHFTSFEQFRNELRKGLSRQARRYQMRLQVVGTETYELSKLGDLIEDLSVINRDMVFAPAAQSQDMVKRFRQKIREIEEQIDLWAATLDGPPEYFGEDDSALAERIVLNTVRHFLHNRLRPVLATDLSYHVVADRSRLATRLDLLLGHLKSRLARMAQENDYVFLRDEADNRLRLALEPADMLDQGTALRLLFADYQAESEESYETVAGLLTSLHEIVTKTNPYVTQDQIVSTIEQILFHLTQAHSTPTMLIIGTEIGDQEFSTDPRALMFNTVFNAMDILISRAQSIALNVRDPAHATVRQDTIALIQNFNYYMSVFKLLSESDVFPLIRTEEGPVIFDEAVNFGLEPEYLRRAFQAESVELGTNPLWSGDRSQTAFARLESLLDQLEAGLEDWDTADLLAFYGFGRIFGDVQPQMLAVLDEVARANFERRPTTMNSREDLVGSLVANSVSQIVVDRLYGWIQTENYGFVLKEEAENYVRFIREELRLAAARINTLARRPDYAYQRHPRSGEVSLDVSELVPLTRSDQAALSIGDRLLDAHFRSVEYLGDAPSVTFTDKEVDQLVYTLETGSADLFRQPELFGKLIHQINTVYRKEKGVNTLTRLWLTILAEHLNLPLKKLKNVFRWFKFVQLDTESIERVALSEFFRRYTETHRDYPGVYESFTYYVPPNISDKEKLSLAVGNMETMTGMFSKNFIHGRSVLKADIPGRDYYVGLEFGVPENGFGLNVVMGVNDAESDIPFPNVFMRIGIDTQGPDLRVNFMQGVAGQEKMINEDFVQRMGFHPGIALLYIAVDLAHQGHVHFVNGQLDPAVDPFRTLHGIRPEFIPSLRNRLSRSTINIMKGYDDFGLRKKSAFSRWRSVNDLVRLLIPQRMAQRDMRARSIARLHEAFRNLKEIPARSDKAQLSEQQRIAALELAAADMFRFVLSGDPNYPDIPRLLSRLNLGLAYDAAVRGLVALKADEGNLGRRFDDQAILALTPEKRVAVLELVSEQLALQGEGYVLSLNDILEKLDIPYELGTEVYRLIMAAARVGIFSDQDVLPPRAADQAQLSASQRTAILEYVSEKLGMSDGTYNPNFREILDALSIPQELSQEVYRWILINAKAGIFDFSQVPSESSFRDEALMAEDTKGGIDFNPANLDLRETGSKVTEWTPTPASADLPAIRGVVPVLIQVTPVTNLPLLLGRVPSNSPKSAPAAAEIPPGALPANLRLSRLPGY